MQETIPQKCVVDRVRLVLVHEQEIELPTEYTLLGVELLPAKPSAILPPEVLEQMSKGIIPVEPNVIFMHRIGAPMVKRKVIALQPTQSTSYDLDELELLYTFCDTINGKLTVITFLIEKIKTWINTSNLMQ